MELSFQIDKVPRSMPKEEWKKWWRWARVKRKDLERERDRQVVALNTLPLPNYVREDIIEKLINPPLLIPPWA